MAKMIDEAMAAFLRGRSAVAHLVDSFDRFCEDVPRLFRETEAFSVEKEGCKASIKLLDGCLRPPEVAAPWKARLGDESYAARMYATIEIQLTNPKKIDESFRFNDVFIGEIPCMIGSRLSDANVNAKTDCLFDPGAYFIIDGAEKAIVPQESHSLSRCSISHRDGGVWKAYVGYPSRGLSFRKLITTVTIDNGEIELGVPGADRVPVVVAFRALGLSTDKNILEVVGGAANDPELADLLLPSLRSAAKKIKKFQDDRDVDHRDAAVNLEFLATTKRRLEGDYLDSLFPVLASGRSKAIYLGYVVELLCSARLGRRQIQKNSLTDRRIVGVGELFAMMLTKAMNRFMRETCKRVLLSKTITEDVFSSGIVTSDFRNGFKGGPWADPKAYATGVVEALKRHNVSCALSHLRRVRAPSLYSGKVTDSRYPNKSHTGRFCPVETPDGEHCGHLKALALFATISARRDEGPVIEKLVEHMEEIEDVSLEELHGFVKVFLNGRLLGFAGNGPEVAFQLRKFRREGEIHPEVEVVLNNHGELHVFTDGGRILRPLFIVEGNQCLLPDEKLSELIRLSNDKKIDFLLREGAVEFIGPEEEERCLIASRLKDLRTAGENIAYTHLEIHPGSILSFAASTIPFSDHNLSTRVTYQAQKHSKQAIGYYSCNPSKRFDTTSDQLFYPQKQIISTRMCHFLSGSDPARAGWPEKMMHGQSCIVAVACYDGYNQEDSLIINQSAADRGLFCSTHLRTHRHTTAPDERFGRPEEEDGSPQQRYQHLEADGFPEVGARLQASHAVIGKMRKMKDGTVADSSVFLKNFEGGSVKEVAYVCSKQATQGPQGPQTVKVQIGSTRSAQVGDKFSSLHGQKGVVGACLSHEDLPFTRQGIVPDVIINPHAFPTRQTLGQMLESVAGKAAAMGQKTSATPFCGHSPEQVSAALHKNKSHTGRFCPVETPDGEHCGHLKALALFATISARRDEGPVIEKLVEHMEEIEDVSLEELHGFVKVFLNGRLLGFAGNGPEVAFQLRKFRREGEIHPEVEVVLNNHGELHVFTDGGRILRPLFIVEGNQCLLPDEKLSELIRLSNDKKIDFLLREGAVEFIGPEEEERCLIASRLKDLRTAGENIAYTHLEIHPGSILSFAASTIPFSDHNLSTRVTYQAQKHSKQAIGYYSCNPSKRFDTTSDQLFYPQKQIISTRMCHFLSGSDPARAGWPEKMMHGQSCIVAVACYDGYNQEDSLIINQSAADRGLFCSTHLRTHRHTTAPDERFGRPEEEDGSPQQRYQHLEADGFPEVGARLQASHAVIGKMRKMKDGTVADSSVFLKNFEGGSVKEVAYVCSKQATQGPQGPQTVKVQIGSTRSAQVGDKFSSLHGQKGVVGACLSHEDLPFTRQGIVPDVIINPHAFPTRQTLGQMLESVAGKAAAMGQKTSATPFCGHSPEQVSAALHKSGFQKFGNEKFYNGFYGSMIRAEIFVGICFYQKLMHMVDDKIKWRRIGRHDSITRQPIGDRQKYGGIKFSQMERCSLVAHGAAASIQERMFRLSDPHAVDVCTRCDRMASIGRTRMPYCRFCRDEFPSFVSVAIPYSCKLLVQELNSMGIDLRLMTDSSAALRPKQGLA